MKKFKSADGDGFKGNWKNNLKEGFGVNSFTFLKFFKHLNNFSFYYFFNLKF